VNTWLTPVYRAAKSVGSSSLGAFEAFLGFILPKVEEREMLLNWMAWNLQNEAQKGKWAIFLFSEKHGTGKSTLADVCKALFGEANTARSNGVSKLVARFNKEVLEKKLVVVEEVEVKKGLNSP
jgi:phage/plasmid-associated DNA primase